MLSLLPLLAFWWLEESAGLRAAIGAAMAFTVLELGITWWREHRLNKVVLVSAGVVLTLGGMSLASDDPRFVLLSPALGDLIFAALLVGAGIVGPGALAAAMEAQDPDGPPLHPLERGFLRAVELRFAVNLAVHALWVAWAATVDRSTWMWVSGPGQYVLLGVQMLGEVAWGRLVVSPRVDEALAAGQATMDGGPRADA